MQFIEQRLKRPGAKQLQKLGFSSNGLTLTGLAIALLAGSLLATSLIPVWAVGLLFLLGCSSDFFDGALARINSTPTRLGGWMDTVSDKGVEAAILAGIYVYSVEPTNEILAFASLTTVLLVSFVKAAAEEKGIRLNWDEVQILGHPGRVVIIGTGLVLTGPLPYTNEQILTVTLTTLLAFNILSLAQRCIKIIVSHR